MRLVLGLVATLGAGAVWADDAALMIGNERYTALDRVVGGAAIATADMELGRIIGKHEVGNDRHRAWTKGQAKQVRHE